MSTESEQRAATQAPVWKNGFQMDNGRKFVSSLFCMFASMAKEIAGNVTLEPVLFIKAVAEGTLQVVADTLLLERYCRIDLNFSQIDCDSMDDANHTDVQLAAQQYDDVDFYLYLMTCFIPVVLIIMAGCLSQFYGRKLLMIIILILNIAYAIVNIVTVLNPNWSYSAVHYAKLILAMLGTEAIFDMAVYAYISDITSTTTRTKRVSFLDAIWYLGGPIGTLLGGGLYQSFGYITVFVTSAILTLCGLIYIVFNIKESIYHLENHGTKFTLLAPFRYSVELFQTAFRKRTFNRKIHLFSLLGIKLAMFLVSGHQVYLWSRRVLEWNATSYSTWSGIDQGVRQLGTVLWVWLASIYGLHDTTVAIVGLISALLWSISLACIDAAISETWWLVQMATVLGILQASVKPALLTLVTCCVAVKYEVGHILALLGLLESVWAPVDAALFNFLYNEYADNFPQINFVVQVAIGLFLLAALAYLRVDWLRNSRDGSHLIVCCCTYIFVLQDQGSPVN